MKIIDFEIIEEESSEETNQKYFDYLKEGLGCQPIIFKVKLEEDPNNFYYLSPKKDPPNNPSFRRCKNCVFSINSNKHDKKFTYADGKKICPCCSQEFCDSIQENLEKKIEDMDSTLHKKIINRLIFLDNERAEAAEGNRFFSTNISSTSLRKHFCEVYCPLEKNQHMKNRCWEKEENCILKNLIDDIENEEK